MRKHTRSTRFRSHGLSLVEAMISLVLTSMLLTAVAAAFSGASQAIEMNDNYFRCTQAARVSMDQILGEIRNCDSLDMSTANTIRIIRPAAGSGPYSLTTNEVERDFVYDTVNKRITLQIFYSGGTSSPLYELATNVTSCTFGPADTGLDYTGLTEPVHVPIKVTVTNGVGNDASSLYLSGSAAPRRAMKF